MKRSDFIYDVPNFADNAKSMVFALRAGAPISMLSLAIKGQLNPKVVLIPYGRPTATNIIMLEVSLKKFINDNCELLAREDFSIVARHSGVTENGDTYSIELVQMFMTESLYEMRWVRHIARERGYQHLYAADLSIISVTEPKPAQS